MARTLGAIVSVLTCALVCGCTTMKESDTARTGVEQLLVSTAIDRSLDRVDLAPLRGAKVYIEQKYLDCVDKNYIFVSMNQRLMNVGCTIVEKAEDSDVVVQLGSGGVGTDRQELFAGVPEIPLPPPSPIAIPKLAIYSRNKANGTAKLIVLAYDAKTRQPVINTGASLARSDYKSWQILGMGSTQGGVVHKDLVAATGEADSVLSIPESIALRKSNAVR